MREHGMSAKEPETVHSIAMLQPFVAFAMFSTHVPQKKLCIGKYMSTPQKCCEHPTKMLCSFFIAGKNRNYILH